MGEQHRSVQWCGGLIQVGGINASTLRFVTAVQAGGQLGQPNNPALLGELGLAAHFGANRGLGLHTGLTLDMFSPGNSACGFQVGNLLSFNAFARAEWFLKEYSLGVGMRSLAPFRYKELALTGPSGCTGRPLRDDHGLVSAGRPLEAHFDRRRAPGNGWLSKRWREDAATEAASIPAFLELARQLIELDAPDALTEVVLNAVADEIHHAELCAKEASRWSRALVLPTLPLPIERAPLEGTSALERLAVESYVDGCLGEGRAAARAEVAATMATDAAGGRAQARIARDEAKHAELAWAVVDFAIRRGGSSIREALSNVSAEAAQASASNTFESSPSRRELRDAERFGVVSSEAAERAERASDIRARARLDRVLASSSGGRLPSRGLSVARGAHVPISHRFSA